MKIPPHFRRALNMFHPYRGRLALAFLGMILTASTEPMFPAVMRQLLDRGFVGKPTLNLWMVPVAIIGIFVLRGFSTFLTTYMMTWVTSILLNSVRAQMFERMLNVPASFYSTKALAASVRDKVKQNGGNIVSLEGEETGEWVLVDLGDMIVHIMQPAIRAYYRLEEIWGDKEVKMGAAKRAKKTATSDDAVPKKAARHLTVTQQAAADGEDAPKKPARKTAAKSATGAVKTAAKKTAARKAAKTPVGKTVKVAAPKSASVRKAPAKRARAE
jgi:ribosome-associated protein